MSARAGNPTVSFDLSAIAAVPPTDIARSYEIGAIGDVRRDVMPGVLMQRGKDLASPLAPPIVSKCKFNLFNFQGTYQITGASAIEEGDSVGIMAALGSTDYDLWTGSVRRVSRITPGSSRQLSIQCLGSMHTLIDFDLSTALYEDIRVDQCIQVILDAAGITGYTLAVADTTLKYWWLSNEEAYGAILELLASEGLGAAFFSRADGTLEFQNRNFRTTNPRSLASQWDFIDGSGVGVDGVIFLEPLVYDVPRTYIVNECIMNVVSRSEKALQPVWQLDGNIVLGAGATMRFNAVLDDPVANVEAPTRADGDFTRVTGSADPTIALNRTSGQRVLITLTASSAVTIADLRLRATPITVDNSLQIINTVPATDAIAQHGKRTRTLRARKEIDPNVATDICNATVLAYQTGLPRLYIRLTNSTNESAQAQLQARVSDRVSIFKEDDLGLNTTAYVEEIIHQVKAQGAVHETVLGCTGVPAFTDESMILGSGLRGILGTNTLGA